MTGGLRTTYGSLLHANDVPAKDEAMVERLRAAGAIILAKTNTPEFGSGSHTDNKVFGPTRNPYDPMRTPGGSSGGSAAALATGMLPLAHGSDTGGSLRNPATWCGVVGFRPTPGLVARENRTLNYTHFSVQGPMGRCVADASLLLAGLAGNDTRDALAGPQDANAFVEPTEETDFEPVTRRRETETTKLMKLKYASCSMYKSHPDDDEIYLIQTPYTISQLEIIKK